MSDESDDPVAKAAERLTRALSRVEIAVGRLKDRVSETGDSDTDRARLAEALDDAQSREAAIAAAANDASDALATAIVELREAAADAEASVEADHNG